MSRYPVQNVLSKYELLSPKISKILQQINITRLFRFQTEITKLTIIIGNFPAGHNIVPQNILEVT